MLCLLTRTPCSVLLPPGMASSWAHALDHSLLAPFQPREEIFNLISDRGLRLAWPCLQGRWEEQCDIHTWSPGGWGIHSKASQCPHVKAQPAQLGASLHFALICAHGAQQTDCHVFIQIFRQEKAALLLKLPIAMLCCCRSFYVIRRDWLLCASTTDIQVFATGQHSLQLSLYMWFRACNRCCQLPWFWCKQGYHKHCRGGNIPKQISQGRHEPQNLGLSSRKPYKQSEPRSQRGARSLPALALQLLTQPESKFQSLPAVGGSACVRPVSKGLQEQDHAVNTGTRARMLDVEAVLTDPWAHCFVQVVLWCSASTQKAHCNGDDQEMFISPVTP